MGLLRTVVFSFLLVVTWTGGTGTIVDLSHTLDENNIRWPITPKFNFSIIFRQQFPDYWLEMNQFLTAEHYGTHIDAPAHVSKGKWRVHEIPLERLIGPGVVIDISEKAKTDPDAQLEVSDIVEWEKNYGRIPDGAIVLMYSGWATRWPNASLFFNTDQPMAANTYHFPGFHEKAASWLVANRGKISGVGVDTASIDYGQSPDFKSHQTFYAQNIYGLEGLANLDKLPAVGAKVYATPIKLYDGSGCPIRVFAILDEEVDGAPMQISTYLIVIPAAVAYILSG